MKKLDIWSLYNGFWLHSNTCRVNKMLSRYELLKMSKNVDGDILECGILKGVGLAQLAKFRDFLGMEHKRIIGFDVDGFFGESINGLEEELAVEYLNECNVDESFDFLTLHSELKKKGFCNFEFVLGDIVETSREFCSNHNGRFSFINIDVDAYEPTKAILEESFSKLNVGGIIVLDEYDSDGWGERRAADEFFKDRPESILRNEFGPSPSAYVVKLYD